MDENQLKEREELEKLLNEPDEDQDDSTEDKKTETSSEDEDKGGSTPPADENAEDENEEDSEDNDDSEKDESEEDDESQNNKERWNGKSREEVIKEYESLEARIAALEGKDKPKDDSPEEKEEDKSENKDKQPSDIPSPEELQKMTPTDFAQWVMQRIDEGVKKTIESQTQLRNSVKSEIAEAKKEHPLGDPDYRKMVLAIIDAASAKGTVIPLKEACKQVDAFLGKHKGESNDATDISDEERSRLKKAKAQVESGAGAPAQPDGSDAETKRIQKALGRTGSRGSLGGLGL